jgi:hypothetical protein
MIEPNRVKDDASRKTMAFQEGGIGVGFHPDSLHGKRQANNLTVPYQQLDNLTVPPSPCCICAMFLKASGSLFYTASLGGETSLSKQVDQ